MKSVRKIILLTAAAGLMLVGSVAMAADTSLSGTPATTVELGNLDAVSFGTVSLGEDAASTEALCVYSNADSAGAYQVTFTSGEGDFKLVNGSNEIPYSVSYNDSNAVGGALVTYNSALTGQDTGGIVEYPCTADNAMIEIRMAADNIEAVPAQAYSGTLTMVVSAP